jgi:hypothetical protein
MNMPLMQQIETAIGKNDFGVFQSPGANLAFQPVQVEDFVLNDFNMGERMFQV